MEIPFTQTFFKEVNLYNELIYFERQGKKSWPLEKIVLHWAAGNNHTQLATPLTRDIVESIFRDYKSEVDALPEETIKYSSGLGRQDVLSNLIERGFGHAQDTHKFCRINNRGLLAGKILRRTSLLRRRYVYRFWNIFWWGVFLGTVLLLVMTLFSAFVDLMSDLNHIRAFLSR